MRVFDVSDLVHATDDKATGSRPAGVKQAEEDAPMVMGSIPILQFLFQKGAVDKGSQAGDLRINGLLRSIGAFIEPALDKGDVLQAVGDRGIVVRASEEKLTWIDRFLVQNRRALATLVCTEIEFFEVDDVAFKAQLEALFTAAGRAARSDRKPDMTRAAFFAPGAETDAFLAVLRKAEGVKVMTAPRFVSERASTFVGSIGEHVSYVRDYKLSRSETKLALIADPVVDTVHDGISMRGTVATLPSGKLGLDFACAVSVLERPIGTFTSTLDGGTKVTVQLPSVKVRSVETSVELKDGDTAFFALPPHDKRHVVVRVRVADVQLDASLGGRHRASKRDGPGEGRKED